MPQLRYDGPASVFEDPTSSTVWNVGETAEVSDETAARLLGLEPGKWTDKFTVVDATAPVAPSVTAVAEPDDPDESEERNT